jgi:hypothetical protein
MGHIADEGLARQALRPVCVVLQALITIPSKSAECLPY